MKLRSGTHHPAENLKTLARKELMASTDLKVYEISDKVGFDSAFYFSKVFKKLEGVSPREYMQRMKVSYVDAKDEATV